MRAYMCRCNNVLYIRGVPEEEGDAEEDKEKMEDVNGGPSAMEDA